MALIRVDWNPSDKKIRRFGGLLILFALAAAGLAWRRGSVRGAAGAASVGVLLGAVSAAAPKGGRLVYKAWTAAAFVIGAAVSTVLLLVLYYFVVTPLGLFFRWRGRDALGLAAGGRDSYWTPLDIPEDKAYFERLS